MGVLECGGFGPCPILACDAVDPIGWDCGDCVRELGGSTNYGTSCVGERVRVIKELCEVGMWWRSYSAASMRMPLKGEVGDGR